MPAFDGLLDEINRDLPKGVDWKKGAREYVQLSFVKLNKDGITSYALTKPMNRLNPENAERSLEEAIAYLSNFVNVLKLLRLKPGANVMDVACGAGWMSHYFSRFGYKTFGFDIASDFVDLAKQRLTEDRHLGLSATDIDHMFATHDIEASRLPAEHHGKYDAIVLESCLHHFYNPISALGHLAECLSEIGVIMLIEGENRADKIRQEYMAQMNEYHTIERPYKRDELIRVLHASGLPHFEFLGQINGFFSPRDPIWGNATDRLRETERGMNLCIAARDPAAIDRVLPSLLGAYTAPQEQSARAPTLAPHLSELRTRLAKWISG
jgi:2-polyprenyl-3-methyl-5-hydroxy-6-metoxy-1,4-benzoquinol methylase